MACTLTHSQQLVAAAHAWQHVFFLFPAMFAGQQGEGEVIKGQMCKQWQHLLSPFPPVSLSQEPVLAKNDVSGDVIVFSRDKSCGSKC